MGSISNFIANELLDHIYNAAYTPPATIYLAMGTADFTAAGLSVEISGNGYARIAITFGAAASRAITQSAVVTFPTATADWAQVTHYAIFDASTAGNIMAFGALDTARTVLSGKTLSVATSECVISVVAGEYSDYLADISLDFVFRNQTFAAPATYVGFTTATITDSMTGSTITEVSGGSYARKQVNVNGGSAPTWTLASSQALDNVAAITFTTPTASWGTATSTFIADALTAGNLLMYDNGMTDTAIGSGDPVEFPIGDYDISLS